MFKEIRINNFKALVDFEIKLGPVTAIIGDNASGKSSFLQAVDFLCKSIDEDFNIIIERRGWTVENIKTKKAASNRISFSTLIELENGIELRWDLILEAITATNSMVLVEESVKDCSSDTILLQYNRAGKTKNYIRNEDGSEQLLLMLFEITSSLMKLVSDREQTDYRLKQLKKFLRETVSFDMLNPDSMRLSSRGKNGAIGSAGNNLPSFVKNLSEKERKELILKLNSVLNGRISKIDTKTKGRPGWTQIEVEETYRDRALTISSKEMSDGMLRILAFVSLTEMRSGNAAYLFDEIENGINVSYVEELLKLMTDVYKKKGCQLIYTTHSTVFMDYIDPDSIVMLYRDNSGFTKARKIFEIAEMKEKLKYMYPGEVILNMDLNDFRVNLIGGNE